MSPTCLLTAIPSISRRHLLPCRRWYSGSSQLEQSFLVSFFSLQSSTSSVGFAKKQVNLKCSRASLLHYVHLLNQFSLYRKLLFLNSPHSTPPFKLCHCHPPRSALSAFSVTCSAMNSRHTSGQVQITLCKMSNGSCTKSATMTSAPPDLFTKLFGIIATLHTLLPWTITLSAIPGSTATSLPVLSLLRSLPLSPTLSTHRFEPSVNSIRIRQPQTLSSLTLASRSAIAHFVHSCFNPHSRSSDAP